MARIDKVSRVLFLYSELSEGKKINKVSFCTDMEIDSRTFDRDIQDIRIFLSESFRGDILDYDRKYECYYFKNYYQPKPLLAMEQTYLFELLKSSENLRKDEFSGLVSSILNAGERNKYSKVKKIASKYIDDYPDKTHGKALLKLQWDLQQCIVDRDMIQLCFYDNLNLNVSPIALWGYGKEIYLFVYNEEDEVEVFPLSKINSFQLKGRKFEEKKIREFDLMSRREIDKKLEGDKHGKEED